MWINITKDSFDRSDFKGLNYLYQIITYKPSGSNNPRYNIAIDIAKVENSNNFKKLETIEPVLKSFWKRNTMFMLLFPNIPYKITSKKGKQNYNVEETIPFLTQTGFDSFRK